MENELVQDSSLDAKATKPAQNKKPKSKPPSRSKRDQGRQDSYRVKQNAKTESDFAKTLDKELFFGFGSDVQAAVSQMVQVTDQATVLPITTRGIGMYTQSIFIKLYQQYRNIPNCTPYELYRVSLAQLELKLIHARRAQLAATDVAEDDFAMSRMTTEFREATMACPLNFGPIANISLLQFLC